MIPAVCWPQRLLRFLVIRFSCYSSTQPFYYVLSGAIFYLKIVSLPLHPFVGLSSWILHQLGRISITYFGKTYFICIAWLCDGIFWVCLLSSISFDLFLPVVISDFSAICFGLFIPINPFMFSFFYILHLSQFFFTCSSGLISYSGFLFYLGSQRGKPILK